MLLIVATASIRIRISIGSGSLVFVPLHTPSNDPLHPKIDLDEKTPDNHLAGDARNDQGEQRGHAIASLYGIRNGEPKEGAEQGREEVGEGGGDGEDD